jgi:hypothetical protein
VDRRGRSGSREIDKMEVLDDLLGYLLDQSFLQVRIQLILRRRAIENGVNGIFDGLARLVKNGRRTFGTGARSCACRTESLGDEWG